MSIEENKRKGYIPLYRSLMEHSLYPYLRKYTDFEAWVDILLTANHSAKKIMIDRKLVEIDRGELFTSEQKLGFRWMWSRTSVRSFLKMLQDDGMITKNSTSKYTKIFICNYESYQETKTAKKQQKNINRTSEKHQPNTNNNDNNENKDKPNPFFDCWDKIEFRPGEEEKFRPICEEFLSNSERVQKLESPLTSHELYKLVVKYGKDRALDILRRMDNYKPLLTKSVNAYKTAINWLNSKNGG